MRDNIEFDLPDGRKVGFRFGTYALSIACDLSKEKNMETFYATIIPRGDGTIISQTNLLHLYYGAACQYADHKGQVVDFRVSTVSEWLEDIGIDKCKAVFSHFLRQYIPKNDLPPQKPGAKKKRNSR